MTPENTTKLYAAFPHLYSEHVLSSAESGMHWGFQCGDGWFDLLWKLSETITTHASEVGIDLVASVVKEKFGGLRFRIRQDDAVIAALIHEVEHASHWICQACAHDNRTGNDPVPGDDPRCRACGGGLGRY